MNTANFEKVIAVLQDLQSKSIIQKYAIGGAFAATLYDEPISTIDLDIFFLFSQNDQSSILSLTSIYDYAREKGFSFDHEFIDIHGWLVQFVESSHNALWKEGIEQARYLKVGDFDVPVIEPEHLVAMWLFAGRIKDYQKITIFHDAGILDMEKLLDILRQHDLVPKWEKEKQRFIND